MKHLLHHRWTLAIALLTIITISGCGQKSDNSANAPSGGETTSASPAPSSAASPAGGGSSTTTTKTIPEEAKKLGVEPQGGACPKNAPVKGIVTKKRGNIYRGPKAPDYAKAKVDICFKDQATAEKAGFKAPSAK
jgi:predicted small lipoprotein YifL